MFRHRLQRLRNDFAAMQPGWLRRTSTAQRKALACTLISLLGWSVWNGFRQFDHPWGDLSRGQFTDHFSHMNAARIFPRIGRDIWRHPIMDQFRTLDPDELSRLPSDVRPGASGTGGVFYVPGWPSDKPLAISWSQKSRMYPPGDMVLVAPIALLYHYTSLPFTEACRLLFALFLVTAHVALFFFFLTYFESQGSGIDWLVCFLVYSHVIHWTLEGFYDPVAIIPLVLCVRYIGRNKGLAAVVAYCAGAFLHFRVFFQAPWAAWGAWLMLRGRFWRHLRARHVVALVIASGLGLVSLYTFGLDWESLQHVGINNPFRHASVIENKSMVWNLDILLVVCGLTLLACRAWFDLVTIAWMALITFTLREFYAWHLLVSMAWFVAPSPGRTVRGVRVAFLVTLMALAFGETFALNWPRMLYHSN
jgi:hypothetical protein